MKTTLSLLETADALGLTEKTVRQLVRRGALATMPRPGGQGVAYRFDPEVVASFRRNEQGAVMLARCLYGLKTDTVSPSMRRRSAWADASAHPFAYRDEVAADGKRIRRYAPGVGRLPYLLVKGAANPVAERQGNSGVRRYPARVPDPFLSWARQAAAKLKPREVEYLCAACIAAACPEAPPTAARFQKEFDAVDLLHARIDTALGSLTPDLRPAVRALFYDALEAGDYAEMRRIFRRYFPASEFPQDPIPAVRGSAIIHRAAVSRRGKFPPSKAEVGRILGIQRAQAGQLHKAAFARLRRFGLLGFLIESLSAGPG